MPEHDASPRPLHDGSSTPASPGAPADPGAINAPGTGDPGLPRTRRRWVLAALAALAVALFTVPLLQGPDSTPGATDAAVSTASGPACAAGEGKANLDFTLKDMSGADVPLSKYKGKVVLLNFWATWCGPCKVEIPEFVEVYNEHRDQGFEILGVLTQDDAPADELRAFASSLGINYPVLRGTEAFEEANGPIYALPTTFVIDRHGTICTKHMGMMPKAMVEQEIKGLL